MMTLLQTSKRITPRDGFSVVEATVAMGLLATATMILAASLSSTVSMNRTTEERDKAAQACEAVIEQIQDTSFDGLAAAYDGYTFEVQSLDIPEDRDSAGLVSIPASYLEQNSGDVDFYEFNVSVAWIDSNNLPQEVSYAYNRFPLGVYTMSMHTTSPRQALTMLEVMVASGIFAMIMASASQAMTSAVQTKHMLSTTMDASQQSQRFINELGRTLRSADIVSTTLTEDNLLGSAEIVYRECIGLDENGYVYSDEELTINADELSSMGTIAEYFAGDFNTIDFPVSNTSTLPGFFLLRHDNRICLGVTFEGEDLDGRTIQRSSITAVTLRPAVVADSVEAFAVYQKTLNEQREEAFQDSYPEYYDKDYVAANPDEGEDPAEPSEPASTEPTEPEPSDPVAANPEPSEPAATEPETTEPETVETPTEPSKTTGKDSAPGQSKKNK